MQEQTVSGEGITLDLLLVRIHGWRGQELVTAALDLNPGLAGEGLFLKQGRTVKIPELPPITQDPLKPTIDLFG